MSDADLYRQYAREAMHGSSKIKDENEKQALVDLALTWAQAALMGDRVLGSSFVSSLCDVGEAASQADSDSEFSVGSGAGTRCTSVLCKSRSRLQPRMSEHAP
jgi:hypothetical protein